MFRQIRARRGSHGNAVRGSPPGESAGESAAGLHGSSALQWKEFSIWSDQSSTEVNVLPKRQI